MYQHLFGREQGLQKVCSIALYFEVFLLISALNFYLCLGIEFIYKGLDRIFKWKQTHLFATGICDSGSI